MSGNIFVGQIVSQGNRPWSTPIRNVSVFPKWLGSGHAYPDDFFTLFTTPFERFFLFVPTIGSPQRHLFVYLFVIPNVLRGPPVSPLHLSSQRQSLDTHQFFMGTNGFGLKSTCVDLNHWMCVPSSRSDTSNALVPCIRRTSPSQVRVYFAGPCLTHDIIEYRRGNLG